MIQKEGKSANYEEIKEFINEIQETSFSNLRKLKARSVFLYIHRKKEENSPQSWQASRLVRQCESLLPVGRIEIRSLILKGDGACVGWNFDLLKGPLFEDLCNPQADLTEPVQSSVPNERISFLFFLAYHRPSFVD